MHSEVTFSREDLFISYTLLSLNVLITSHNFLKLPALLIIDKTVYLFQDAGLSVGSECVRTQIVSYYIIVCSEITLGACNNSVAILTCFYLLLIFRDI